MSQIFAIFVTSKAIIALHKDMKTTEEQIVNLLGEVSRGKIVFPDDFSAAGSNDAVRQALHRLEEKQTLVRLAHGIYLYPKTDSELGILYPTVEEIARAIAKRDRARILPTGAYAVHALGLSTQVPMNIVYLTDGSARSIKVGKRTVRFKKTVPRNLALKGSISSLAIQALREIGKDMLQPEQVESIRLQLKYEPSETLTHDLKLAPVWMRAILQPTNP